MNLNSLGIPSQEQARSPTADFMPPSLNPASAKYWPIAVGKVQHLKNSRAAWTSAINEFVKLCEKNSVLAFTNSESDNDKILTRMIEARREIVRFINANKVLEDLKTYRVKRIVRMTTSGFTLTVDVQARQLDEDPTLMGVLGQRQMDGRYTRNLLSNLTFFVYNDGAKLSQRWHFGYDLSIDIFPNIPGKRLPTAAEQERFVLEVMYLPLVRCYRPKNSIHQLI